MKHKYITLVFGSLLSFISGIYAQPQNPFSHAMQPRNATQGQSMSAVMKNAVEDPSKRSLFSSMYTTPDGNVICRSSAQPLNYYDATGKLQPINIELHSDSRGWVVDQQPNPCYFHSDRSTAISLENADDITFNMNCSINGAAYDEHIASMDKTIINLNLSPDIHKKITFGNNGIETDYILDKSIGSSVTISEELQYSSSYKLMRDNMRGREAKDGSWTGDYILVSNKDKGEAARFHAPLCYDSKGNWCVGSYSVQIKDGKTLLVTTLPSTWLANAVYPIVIDPLVTGSISKWTGKSIPSCIFPNFSDDSIRVTIPAKITITQFIVNYAYETNDAVPVYLTDGKLYFSSPCGGNMRDTISCEGAFAASMPGYCYLDTGAANDFHSLLTCCFAPSCDTQSFYLHQHLSRMAGGAGCDTNWVWYSQYINPTTWYYQWMATVIGHTVEPAAANPLMVTPGTQCSNVCTLKMTVKPEYGVPPYKISDAWDTAKYTVGSYSGCVSTGVAILTLKIPGCPFYCSDSTITVPTPLVIDACGDTAKGWPLEQVVLKATPKVSVAPDTINVCNGAAFDFTLSSCVAGTTFTWTGTNGASGSGNINNTALDTTVLNPYTVVYKFSGTVNGCASSIDSAVGIVNPYPVVTLKGKDTIPVTTSTILTATGGTSYLWEPSTGLSCTTCPNPTASPTVTTEYDVTVTNKEGCSWVDSVLVVVLEDQIIVPNVITPNGDAVNDYFVIKGLQYYPNSSLVIYDRWGKQVYQTSNYQNNWNGGNQSDGVYYYVLTLPSGGKKYNGFFQIIK